MAFDKSRPTPPLALRTDFGQAFDGADELPQLRSQARRGIDDPHPASPPETILEPMVEHVGDAHREHVHSTEAVAVEMTIVTDRPPRDNTQESGFLLGLPNRRLARLFAMVDRALRHDPAPAARSGDE